jgi:exo-beta-1,3-glucanase (GH17 family)
MAVDNQNGNPIATSTEDSAILPAPTPALAASPTAAAAPSQNSNSPDPSPVATPAVEAPTVSNGYGITYNPYNQDGSCKTEDQVKIDFGSLGSFPFVRIYGTDCNAPDTVLSACKATEKKLFAGIFNLDDIPTQVQSIVDAVSKHGDWKLIHTVSIGNELVDQGKADVGTVMAAVGTARGLLKAAGYGGPVVTVDTLNAATANPKLCDESDYCAVNCHPFFETNPDPSKAGSFLTDKISALKNVLADKTKPIIIAETGWPSYATGEKAPIASPSDQAAAIGSIKAAFSSNPGGVILFSAFNRKWVKGNVGQYGQEPYFGLFGDSPTG